MSETHKRKRTPELDNTADVDTAEVSQRERLISAFQALTDELRRLRGPREHASRLERIPDDEPEEEEEEVIMSFADATNDTLARLGATDRGFIFFEDAVVDSLGSGAPAPVEAELACLCARLARIRGRFNFNFEDGCSTVVDTILASVRAIVSLLDPAKDAVIIPEMEVADTSFSRGGYRILLGGSIDYGMVEYRPDEDGNVKGLLLGPGALGNALESGSAVSFVTLGRFTTDERGLGAFFPEAVAQATAILDTGKLDTVRFCLTDGREFYFFLLQRDADSDGYTYYSSTRRLLGPEQSPMFAAQVREITLLLVEWLKADPTPGFYVLHERGRRLGMA